MAGQHELADLAPRDVVAKAILRRMRETGAEHMWLDARHFGAEKWRVRFPTIHETLLSLGIDPVRELIPVVPACHYASGGVRTDLRGESSLPGLFVCGETACTGVHGANRLASNSLLEGLVFGRRIAETLVARLAEPAPPPDSLAEPPLAGDLLDEDARPELQQLMSRGAGVLRDATGLGDTAAGLAALAERDGGKPGTEPWETTNLLTVAAALVQAALVREETRGAHWRDDHPERDDEHWRGHLDTALAPDGTLTTAFEELR
jgi:L-aspartate oxidase